MISYFLLGAAYGLAAAVQPGPFQTFLISLSLRQGWRRAIPAALAPLLSDGPIIVLVLLVLNQVPAWWIRIIRLAGGGYLLYLAFTALRGGRKGLSAVTSPDRAGSGVIPAALVNLLNPNPYIYWSLVTGPILSTGWRASPAFSVAFLAGFYAILISGSAGIISLAAAAGRFGPRPRRLLAVIAALALAGLGFYQIILGVTGRF
jgi:threonine/homoserine/homoserine lactone efflux protein